MFIAFDGLLPAAVYVVVLSGAVVVLGFTEGWLRLKPITESLMETLQDWYRRLPNKSWEVVLSANTSLEKALSAGTASTRRVFVVSCNGVYMGLAPLKRRRVQMRKAPGGYVCFERSPRGEKSGIVCFVCGDCAEALDEGGAIFLKIVGGGELKSGKPHSLLALELHTGPDTAEFKLAAVMEGERAA